jgi:MoaA/NifB/PqqE/SkfB family radical SAM enzyme
VSFSGKVYFCPFIRVEVGDLAESSLEEVWNGERYVELRRRLVENGIFPVCRRCCKVELSPVPLALTYEAGTAAPPRRAIPLTVVR